MPLSIRKIKEQLRPLLISNDRDSLSEIIRAISLKSLINPLFSFLLDQNDLVRWRSISAMGVAASRLAEQEMESGRVIMRRLIWNLNDESGGIGWGSPEAMGEIMAQHDGLAREYATILRSYVRKDENYLEHEILQRGVVWGLGRLAQIRPQLLRETDFHLFGFLKSADAFHRGYAAWALGNLGSLSSVGLLRNLFSDDAELLIYENFYVYSRPVKQLAAEAVLKIQSLPKKRD